MNPMTRRRFLSVTPMALAGTVLLPRLALASTPPGTAVPAGSGPELPVDPSLVVLKITIAGGFVPMGYDFSSPPTLLVTGGGDVYAPGAITLQYPGPLLLPVTHRRLTQAGIDKLGAAVVAAGLLETPPDYDAGAPMVTDVPYTTVEVTTAEGTRTHSAYALGFAMTPPEGTEPIGPVAESTPARQRLFDFVTKMSDLSTLMGEDISAEELFTPERYRILARPADPADVGSPDTPAVVVDWPAGTGVALTEADPCGEVAAATVDDVFATATSLTLFRDAGATYQVWARAVLPGDAACTAE